MSSAGEESFVVVDKSLALLESSVLKETDDKENCAGKSIDDQPAMTDISVGHVSLSPNPKNLDTSGRSEAIDETTVLNRKSNETQSSDGTVPDDGNDIGTKKRCVTLDARIQSIQIQVSDSNGGKIEFGGVECAKVNLVNAELLNRANAETIKLKSTNAKLTQELKTLKMMMVTQHEEIKGLKAQCEVYKVDLEKERVARQKTAALIATDLRSLLKRNQQLIDGRVDEAEAQVTTSLGTVTSIASTPSVVSVAPAPILPPSVTAPPSTPKSTTNVEDHGNNAVSRLYRIQKLGKRPDPVYTVIDDWRSPKGGREFLIEVECNGDKARGTGLNKRLAKRMAAENMLIKMGYTKDEKSASGGNKSTSSGKPHRRVIFKESEILAQTTPAPISPAGGSAGRQLVPGVLLMKSLDNLAFKTSTVNGAKIVGTENGKGESTDVAPKIEATKPDPPAIEIQ